MIRPAWVEYVTALLATPDTTPDHQIGQRLWELPGSDQAYEYLTEVMTENAPNSRAFEVAWDVWALRWGRPA